MKIIICVATLCLLLSPVRNKAQAVFNYRFNKAEFSSNVRLNEIDTRAFRHFLKSFPAIVNEKWFKTDRGYSVVFENDSVLYKIYYGRHGEFCFSLKYYKGKELSAGMAGIVKTYFPDFHIEQVTEQFDGRQLLYEITVANDRVTEAIELYNDEIRNVKEFGNGVAAR